MYDTKIATAHLPPLPDVPLPRGSPGSGLAGEMTRVVPHPGNQLAVESGVGYESQHIRLYRGPKDLDGRYRVDLTEKEILDGVLARLLWTIAHKSPKVTQLIVEVQNLPILDQPNSDFGVVFQDLAQPQFAQQVSEGRTIDLLVRVKEKSRWQYHLQFSQGSWHVQPVTRGKGQPGSSPSAGGPSPEETRPVMKKPEGVARRQKAPDLPAVREGVDDLMGDWALKQAGDAIDRLGRRSPRESTPADKPPAGSGNLPAVEEIVDEFLEGKNTDFLDPT